MLLMCLLDSSTLVLVELILEFMGVHCLLRLGLGLGLVIVHEGLYNLRHGYSYHLQLLEGEVLQVHLIRGELLEVLNELLWVEALIYHFASQVFLLLLR